MLTLYSGCSGCWATVFVRGSPISAGPVTGGSILQPINHVTNATSQVESGEGPFVHSSFDRIAGAAVRRRGQIHRRRPDHELEPVTERDIGRALEHVPNDLVLVAAGGCCDPLHGQVDVYR